MNSSFSVGQPYQTRSTVLGSIVSRVEPFISPLLALGALVLWLTALKDVRLEQMDDLGLISTFPPSLFISLFILCISFFALLYQQRFDRWTLALHFVVLTFMLYGITALIQEVPRFHVSWRHVGIADYIMRHGDVDPQINAYFSWPGFFIFTAFLTEVLGVKHLIPLTAYAPFFFNLLYLGPLYLIFSSTSRDQRLVWLAIWLFYLTNWVGQDYYAPQALSYFFYLTMLGILLHWFRATDVQLTYVPKRLQSIRSWSKLIEWISWRFRIDRPTDKANIASESSTLDPASLYTRLQRGGVLVILLLVFASVVTSHQLTPFFTILAVTGLVLINRCTTRDLPILMSVLTALWIVFMTTAYLSGHIDKVVGGIGSVNENVSVNVVERLRGSVQHLFVVRVRLVMTVFIYILGALGMIRRIRRGNLDLLYAILGLAPFALVIVQPYGGEMIIRAYLFALPAAVFLAAALFYPEPTGYNPWQPIVGVALVTLLLGAGFLFTRYGNERMDYYTSAEETAVEAVYDMSPPGSIFVTSADNLPWKHRELEMHYYRVATPATQRRDTDRIIEIMMERPYTAGYYISTRAQHAYSELFLGEPVGAWSEFTQMLLNTGHFEPVYENEDALVLRFLPESEVEPKPSSQSQARLGPQAQLPLHAAVQP